MYMPTFLCRYQRSFNKKSGRWSASSVKAEKKYNYIPEIMKRILAMRLEDGVGMNNRVVLEADDPRRISAVLAPIPPPPTQEIVKDQKSRFGTDIGQHEGRTVDDPDATEDYYF